MSMVDHSSEAGCFWIEEYNDQKGRTKEEVLDLMRRVKSQL